MKEKIEFIKPLMNFEVINLITSPLNFLKNQVPPEGLASRKFAKRMTHVCVCVSGRLSGCKKVKVRSGRHAGTDSDGATGRVPAPGPPTLAVGGSQFVVDRLSSRFPPNI